MDIKTSARVEEFEATRPNGEVLLIERDIDTGEQTATVLREAPEPEAEATEEDPRKAKPVQARKGK